VEVESFEMGDIVELINSDIDVDTTSSPSLAWKKRLVITGKETYSIKNLENRHVTQLFVHELWLDHKDRLVRWHLNGDSVALSVAFDAFDKVIYS